VRILATYDDELRNAMTQFQASLAETARGKDSELQRRLGESASEK
jgi:phosphoribosylcarboxyaminoimidazole (NCAIR) mutase